MTLNILASHTFNGQTNDSVSGPMNEIVLTASLETGFSRNSVTHLPPAPGQPQAPLSPNSARGKQCHSN